MDQPIAAAAKKKLSVNNNAQAALVVHHHFDILIKVFLSRIVNMLDQQLLQSYTLHAIGFVCVCVLKNCEQALEQKLIITMLKQLLLYMNILIF